MGKITSIRFKNYKSFSSDTTQVFDIDSNINLIIGRNNSGKSSCIDLIEFVYDDIYYFKNRHKIDSLEIAFLLTKYNLECGFKKDWSGGQIKGSHYEYGLRYDGNHVFLKNEISNYSKSISRNLHFSSDQPEIEDIQGIDCWETVASSYNNYANNYAFRRINAERDIIPEEESDSEVVDFNGSGASNLIRKFINYSHYDEKLVEVRLLNELNKIMYPDSKFSNIRIQQINRGEKFIWEIFLEENCSGRYALSQSGSGLKTIILILINLYLIPELISYKGKKIIYAFEEIENNLHPALQRRIFDYLYNFAINNKTSIFLTTHSHVAINTYYGKKSSKIYHVTKEKEISTLKVIDNYLDKVEILDDLDVKASDILQSNGIIWVEGPSDRIYINRWLQIFCDFNLVEGRDYQFLYYGGRLLSHYTTEDNITDLINILTTNRNAAIIIDSDRRAKGSAINSTKQRIRDEFKHLNLICWITKGKEIENYLSAGILYSTFNVTLKSLDQFTIFPDYIKKVDQSFTSHKVDFAHKVTPFITVENSKNILDLEYNTKKLFNEILKWNSK